MKATAARTRIGFQNVLFLTDFSEPSEAALPFAMAIARAYNSKISVLHVLQPDPLLYSTPTSVALAQEAQEDAAKAGMQRVSAQLAGLPHDTLLEWGTGVWPSVEQALKSSATDLIVVGTRGRTGAERFLLGSVAEEIFRRSPVPVLTVGPSSAAFMAARGFTAYSSVPTSRLIRGQRCPMLSLWLRKTKRA